MSEARAATFAAACLSAVSLIAPVARGQDDAPAAPPPEAPASPFHVQLNFDWTTGYFYHGIIQEDTGLIHQPAARLTVDLYDEDDFSVAAILSSWNSFHGQKTGASTRDDFTDLWYESDLIAGVMLSMGRWSLATTYTFFTSPSDAYETVQEVDIVLAFDDTASSSSSSYESWAGGPGGLALHPYVLLGIETGADFSDGAESDRGTYLELGIAPGFSFDLGSTPVSMSFPVSAGFSLENYYQDAARDDDGFGFVQVGAKASIPLSADGPYGTWTLNAGVAALLLGDNTSNYNAGDDAEIIATIGMQLDF